MIEHDPERRRFQEIVDILARGVQRALDGEKVEQPPRTGPVVQRMEFVGQDVVSEHPLTVAVKCRLTRPRPAPPPPRPRKEKGKLQTATVQLARAHRLQRLLEETKPATHRELAKMVRLTPARVTQLLDLLFLAPDIQERILSLPRTPNGRGSLTERDLRIMAAEPLWAAQRKLLSDLEAGVRVRLLVDRRAAKAMKDGWHPTQQITRTRRGLVLSMKTRITADLTRRILGLGNAVEVLAPTSLREEVAATLQQAASRYEGR
jgi:hypothetical protein